MYAQLGRRLVHKIPMSIFSAAWSLWPPYLGAGIRINSIAADYKKVSVSMKQRLRNTNYVGTHFGGSLYAMTDPFYMFMIMSILGREYIVWDKAAHIKFVKPGKGTVNAHFEITEGDLETIYRKLEESPENKIDFVKTVQVVDESLDTICIVEKVIYIRRKSSTT